MGCAGIHGIEQKEPELGIWPDWLTKLEPPSPQPLSQSGRGAFDPGFGLKSLRPLWEKGFRDEGKRFVSQPGNLAQKRAHGNKYGLEAIDAIKHWADANLDYKYLRYPVDREHCQ